MDLVDLLDGAGVQFASGVPDSTLQEFCWAIAEHPRIEHAVAACEGGAVAMAIGTFIATGRPACAYMQNSGLPNALNPLMSLAGPDAYDIPLVLVIGWRARPGLADEPQHRAIGRETPALLRMAGIEPMEVTPGDEAAVAAYLRDERPAARRKALLVPPGPIAGSASRALPDESDRLDKQAVLRALVDIVEPNAVFVTGIGHTGREMLALRLARGENPFSDLPVVGGMGFAASLAIGLAKADPARPVYCLDGDGSFLMHTGNQALVSRRAKLPLVHIVLDNGRHASVGGHPTIGPVDIPALATALGYPLVRQATNLEDLCESARLISGTGRAGLIHVPIRSDVPKALPRPDRGLPEGLAAFRRQAGYDEAL